MRIGNTIQIPNEKKLLELGWRWNSTGKYLIKRLTSCSVVSGIAKEHVGRRVNIARDRAFGTLLYGGRYIFQEHIRELLDANKNDLCRFKKV